MSSSRVVVVLLIHKVIAVCKTSKFTEIHRLAPKVAQHTFYIWNWQPKIVTAPFSAFLDCLWYDKINTTSNAEHNSVFPYILYRILYWTNIGGLVTLLPVQLYCMRRDSSYFRYKEDQ